MTAYNNPVNYEFIFVYIVIKIALCLQEPYEFAFYSTYRSIDVDFIETLYCAGMLMHTSYALIVLLLPCGKANIVVSLVICVIGTIIKEKADSIGALMTNRTLYVPGTFVLNLVLYHLLRKNLAVAEHWLLLTDATSALVATGICGILVEVYKWQAVIIYRISNVLFVLAIVLLPVVRITTSAERCFSLANRLDWKLFYTEGWINLLVFIIELTWFPLITYETKNYNIAYSYALITTIRNMGALSELICRRRRVTFWNSVTISSFIAFVGCTLCGYLPSLQERSPFWRHVAIATTYYGLQFSKSALEAHFYHEVPERGARRTVATIATITSSVAASCMAVVVVVLNTISSFTNVARIMQIVAVLYVPLALVQCRRHKSNVPLLQYQTLARKESFNKVQLETF